MAEESAPVTRDFTKLAYTVLVGDWTSAIHVDTPVVLDDIDVEFMQLVCDQAFRSAFKMLCIKYGMSLPNEDEQHTTIGRRNLQ